MDKQEKQEKLKAIASVLSADYWMSSYAIAQQVNLDPYEVRKLLRKQKHIEMRKRLGYRLRSQRHDEIDRCILKAIAKNKKLTVVAERFGISRQAVSLRKLRLTKEIQAE